MKYNRTGRYFNNKFKEIQPEEQNILNLICDNFKISINKIDNKIIHNFKYVMMIQKITPTP